MSPCPPDAQLTRLLRRELSPQEQRDVEEHLDQCDDCARRLDALTPGTGLSGDVPALLRVLTPAEDRTPDLLASSPSFPAIPGFRIERELGRGGMGIVYLATRLSGEQPVAIKMLLAGPFAHPKQVRRFQTEVAAGRLRHPNIVPLLEWGVTGGMPYFVMEHVAGGTLAQYAAERPLPPHEAACLLETVARAVHFAHQENVIHRDLKPSNILLQARSSGLGAGNSSSEFPAPSPEFVPKVADFGLAKLSNENGTTASSDLLGTVDYMAPEQVLQANVATPQVDVYSLGAILYELLTGRPPFQAATPHQALHLKLYHNLPEPPGRHRPDTPRALAAICLNCLHKDPKRRYASALELAGDLRRFLEGESVSPAPGTWRRRLGRYPHVAALAGAALLLAALVLGGVYLTRDGGGTDENALRRGLVEANERERSPGWTERNLEILREYAKHVRDEADRQWLRARAVECFLTFDVKPGWAKEDLGPVYATAFDPTGEVLAVAHAPPDAPAGRCILTLLDTQTGQVWKTLDVAGVAGDRFLSVAYSHDGEFLAAGTAGGKVHQWTVQGKVPQVRKPFDALCPNVRWVNYAYDDQSQDVWLQCAGDGVARRFLARGPWGGGQHSRSNARIRVEAAAGVQVSRGSSIIVLVRERDDLHFLNNIELAESYSNFTIEGCQAITTSPRRSINAGASADRVVLFDIQGACGEFSTIGHAGQPRGDAVHLAFNPDAEHVAGVFACPQPVRLFDVVGGQLLLTFPDREPVHHVAFAADSGALAVASETGVRLYGIPRREQFTRVHNGGPVGAFALSRDGKRLGLTQNHAAARSPHAQWLTLDADEGTWRRPGVRKEFPRVDGTIPVAFHPNGQRIAVASAGRLWDGPSRVADPDEDPRAGNPALAPPCRSLQYGPDGRLWVLEASGAQIRDPANGQAIGPGFPDPSTEGKPVFADLAPGRTGTAVAGRDGTFRWLAPEGDRAIGSWPLGMGEQTCVALAPHEAVAAVGFASGQVALVRTSDGAVVRKLDAHPASVRSVALSDTLVATGCKAGWLRLWTHDGDEVFSLRMGNAVQTVALSDDGNALAVLVEAERGVRMFRLDRLQKRLSELNIPVGW